MRILVPWKASKLLASSLLVFIMTVCCISSCTRNKKEAEEVFDEQQSTHPASLALDTFGYLEHVIGCSCYLALDSMQFSNQHFVYAEKYGLPDGSGYGFIMLDKNLIRLEVLNFENDPAGKFRKVRLSDETIEVWLNLDVIKSPDPEVLLVTGNIQIHKEDEPVLTEKIIGTCGC